MNDRKIRILEAIIQDYIQTGSPVGSRTLSKKYDLQLSSATIRNEMSDLEELGLITQPHTSAGRIPSDKGYRLYVDTLMDRSDLAPDLDLIIVKMLQDKINNIDLLLEETARLVAMMTNYATIASTQTLTEITIKRVQLIYVDLKSVACVIVTEANVIKHHIIFPPTEVDVNLCLMLSEVLNEHLAGMTLKELQKTDVRQLVPDHETLVLQIVCAIISILQEEDSSQVFTRGTTNILDFYDFNDLQKARELLELLEQKPYLTKLLSKTSGNSVNISIGEENALEPMKECSLVTTTYKLGDCTLGTIGIIGPKRMNYAQVVTLLEHISYHITNMLSE
ncbi:MAG: heat-inducible transcription repressor HrcA [Epulopiscium sp. Nele67-Bin001]|nr:MAG: heat-inducible transcription repressor HrcA [Epulopiscium sp. Nuni2H_MBin001]OON92074.1 MAG: heat-inducible transcription repressor HrcA [Epulopiscium sp. Nele67-Bin001]